MFCKYPFNIAETFKQTVHGSEKIVFWFAKKDNEFGGRGEKYVVN